MADRRIAAHTRRLHQDRPSQENALFAAKLRAPYRAGTIPRERLYQLLDGAASFPVTLVTAPAGSGKTTLLASWVARPTINAAWLSLDADDDDPARFWTHVVAAVRTRHPQLAGQSLAMLRQPRPARVAAVLPTLVAELSRLPHDLILIVDDLHLVADSRIVETLIFLLDHMPPALHLVAASRVAPPLPLARLRASGSLYELDATALRFTPAESDAFLRHTLGAAISAETAATLATRTEGWPAGLQLAALALRYQPDAATFASSFTGGHRFIMDYLAAEVWEHQPESVRQFLLATCILERLSAGLCAAVSDQPDAQAMLERLEREQLFLLPLDDERRWYRYHALFAEMLRARLRQRPEAEAAAFHARAVLWLEEHDRPEEAVRHALAAHEPAYAARLIAGNALALLGRGEWVTLHGWLTALPADLRRARPALALLTAWVLLLNDEPASVGIWLRAAEERLSADTPDGDILPFASATELRGYIAVARAGVAQFADDGAAAIAHCERALADLPADNWRLRGVAYGYLGGGHWILGEADQAARAFEDSFAACERGGMQAFGISSLCLLAIVRFAQARLEASAAACNHILRISTLPGTGFAHQMLARIDLERNQMEAALQHAERAVACAEAEHLPAELALRMLAMARVRATCGDFAGAHSALDQADALLAADSLPAFLAHTREVYGVVLALLEGNLDAASRWARASSLRPEDDIAANREDDYLLLAQVLVTTDEAAPVLDLLERVRTAAAAQGRIFNVIAALALRALALRTLGQTDHALADLALALALGESEGFVRAFADYGAPMAALLAELRAAPWKVRNGSAAPHSAPTDAYIDTVLAACAPFSTPASPPPLPEPLSGRELEVLRLIAAGYSNGEIARELVVALSTIKTHLHHIYAKLGVQSRTQALARARDLHLLATESAGRVSPLRPRRARISGAQR